MVRAGLAKILPAESLAADEADPSRRRVASQAVRMSDATRSTSVAYFRHEPVPCTGCDRLDAVTNTLDAGDPVFNEVSQANRCSSQVIRQAGTWTGLLASAAGSGVQLRKIAHIVF